MNPLQVDHRLPLHLAIVMDGNGRWAKQRALSRVEGHRKGAEVARAVTEECARLGIQVLSLFAFSTDNWSRPSAEVDALFVLLKDYLRRERATLLEQGIRFRAIGDLSRLPRDVQSLLAETECATLKGPRMTLLLGLNYSGQWDILQAVSRVVRDVQSGNLRHPDISPDLFERYLMTSEVPSPDLFIRTSGERRISNFFLYPLAYTELYFSSTLWPDFTVAELHDALDEFSRRDRRFGRILEPQQL
jgi:undecaprenyl diphosphate synthase